MTTVKIALFKGKGLISSLIRWQTDGSYSHAAIVTDDYQVIESWQGAGVRIKTLDSWDNIDLFEVDVTEEQKQRIFTFLYNQIGKKYDYRAIIRFVSRKNFLTNDRWFCSELVFQAFWEAGIQLFVRTWPWEVPPDWLHRSPLVRMLGSANIYFTTNSQHIFDV